MISIKNILNSEEKIEKVSVTFRLESAYKNAIEIIAKDSGITSSKLLNLILADTDLINIAKKIELINIAKKIENDNK